MIESDINVKLLREQSEQNLVEWFESTNESIATGSRGRYQVQVFDEGDWHDLNRWSTPQKAIEHGQAAVEAVYQDFRVIDRESGEEINYDDYLTEGVMSDLDLDVKEAGSSEAYIQNKTKELEQLQAEKEDLEEELDYLIKYASREIGRGGAYDSIQEVDETRKDVEDRLAELNDLISDCTAKLEVVKKSIH